MAGTRADVTPVRTTGAEPENMKLYNYIYDEAAFVRYLGGALHAAVSHPAFPGLA